MKKPVTVVIIASVVAFAMGTATTWGISRVSVSKAAPLVSDGFFDHMFDHYCFVGSSAPCHDLDRMRRQVAPFPAGNDVAPDFEHWFDSRVGDWSAASISREEDGDSMSYRIDIGDETLDNLEGEVGHGFADIRGSASKGTNQDGDGHATSHVQWPQRFAVPAGADPCSAKVNE